MRFLLSCSIIPIEAMKRILFIASFIFVFHSVALAVNDSIRHQDSLNKKGVSFISYDFEHPKKIYWLPEELKEISGISVINDSLVACIEDENGVLYLYDLSKSKIRKKTTFGPEGDYEDVAIKKREAFILRSDGEIYHVSDFFAKHKNIDHYPSGVPSQDNEGIVYDSLSGGLLIACKGKFGKGIVNQLRREIYVFDPVKKNVGKDFLFSINIDSCASFAHKNGIELPTKVKNDTIVETMKVRMSAIAIHPETRDFYILSAFDHAIFIFSESGELKHLQFLNPDLFPQAEGISFLSNGDMLISNEGDGKTQNIIHLQPLE